MPRVILPISSFHCLRTAQTDSPRLGNWHLCISDEAIKNLAYVTVHSSPSPGVFWWDSSRSQTCIKESRCLKSQGALFCFYVESSLKFLCHRRARQRELRNWGEKGARMSEKQQELSEFTNDRKGFKNMVFPVLGALLIYSKLGLVGNNGISWAQTTG